MSVITHHSDDEDDGAEEGEEEEKLLDSLVDFLATPSTLSTDVAFVDDVIPPKKQKRLRKLFDVSDRGKKGYLTHEELNNIFGKLHSIMPHADLIRLARGENTDPDYKVTWPQFLNIFAIAKGSQQAPFNANDKSLPERVGTYLLKAFSKRQVERKARSSGDDPRTGSEYDYEEFTEENKITLVNHREHRKLEWTKIGAIFRAALIGSFFCFISGLVELIAGKHWGYVGDLAGVYTVPTSHVVYFWVVVILINVIDTILEILFLYLDSLRAAALIAGYIGLDPWLMGYVNDLDHAATAIVRAAFELPHPSNQILGIRPLRYSNRLNAFFKAFLWKTKRGLTSVLLGLFLKRLIPRATMKVASPFVSVPIAALWNSLVAWKIICDIYSIVIGNIAISRIITKVVEPRWQKLSDTARQLLYCTAGVAIALEQEIHPTLETLLRLLCRYWGDPPRDLPIDDKQYLQSQLMDIPKEEQLLILQLLAVAIVSNSHISLTSMRYLRNVLLACGLNTDEQGIDELRDQLSSKSYIDVEHITDLFRDATMKDKSRSFWARFALNAKVVSYNLAY